MKVRSVNHFPAKQADDLAIGVRLGDDLARRRVTTAWMPVPLGLVALALHATIFSRPSNFSLSRTKRTAAHRDGSDHG